MESVMACESIEHDFALATGCYARLEPAGTERYRVFTPFMFNDGDHFTIVLKREGDGWVLSDEGHTVMHLSYKIDEEMIRSGARHEVMSSILKAFGLQDRDGELVLPIEDQLYSDAICRFVQALTRVSDIAYLSRERVLSAFREDSRACIA
jgi:hypothetical protein